MSSGESQLCVFVVSLASWWPGKPVKGAGDKMSCEYLPGDYPEWRINTNPDCVRRIIRIRSFTNTRDRPHSQSARSNPQWMAVVKSTKRGDSADKLEINKKRPYTSRRKKVPH
jgi:hypothetical protein